MTTSDNISINILEEVINGKRIDKDKAVHLALHADLLDLAVAANYLRNYHNPIGQISYTIDRNINYTNICNINCTFCAFCRTPSDSRGYVVNYEQLKQKAIETKAGGGTGFLIQGGVNPDLPWDYYLKLISLIRDAGLWVHGFSPVEIQGMAKISGQSLEKTINDLYDAGLGSIPGGGA
jgi:cyclic dehypoxanthinyl futalosine synthase